MAQAKASEDQVMKPKSFNFNEFRLNQEFIDAIIVVNDVEFPIHKVVLAACAPYFWSLFSRWSPPCQKVYKTSIMSAEIMKIILDFAYTSSLNVTEINVTDVMIAADKINSADILRKGSDFILDIMCPKNCIGFWKFTSVVPSAMLFSAGFQYIMIHFKDVVSYDEFLQLSLEELVNIITTDDLNVQQEIIVFESILKWISHKPPRERHIAELLSKVRLALLDEDCMSNVLSKELVNRNPECLKIISRASRLRAYMSNSMPPITGLQNLLARPRLPTAILLAFGGWSGNHPTNTIEAYDIRMDRWISLTNTEHPRAYHGTVFTNGYIYCIGGFNRVEHFSNVFRFSPRRRVWEEVTPMYFRRCYVSVTVLNGFIYALGGYDGHTRTNAAERYEPAMNQWSLIASMHHERSDASATTFQDKVYICGGFNGQECLQTAEYYDPQTDQWTMIAPMNSRRSGLGVIAYAGCVYAVGGFDGNERLRSVEAYNPQTNTWSDVSPMNTQRSNFGIEVVEDRLFVVGGFDGNTTTFFVESYNAATNEWTNACDMSLFRSALSCCVIHGLPNMADYAYPRDTLRSVEEDSEPE